MSFCSCSICFSKVMNSKFSISELELSGDNGFLTNGGLGLFGTFSRYFMLFLSSFILLA